MIKFIRNLIGLVVFLFVLLVIGVGLISYAPDTKSEEMIAKYGGANPQFIDRGDGFKIHYRDQGNIDGPALVLVHGTSASLHTWEPWVAILGDEFRIITFDLPGHGITGPDPEKDYSIAAFEQSITIVTDALGVERFALGGNSLGGEIAWHYALDNPQKVSELILVDSSGVYVDTGEEAQGNIGFKIMQHPWGRKIAQIFTPRFLIEASVHQSLYNQSIITDEMVDRYWELLRFPGNREALALRIAQWKQYAEPEALEAILQPTLILWGREDALIPVGMAAIFEAHIPDSELIIYEDTGHAPMEEIAAQSAQDVREFLNHNLKASTVTE